MFINGAALMVIGTGERIRWQSARALAAALRSALATVARVAPDRLLPPAHWPRAVGEHTVGARDLWLADVEDGELSACCWYPAATTNAAPMRLLPADMAEALASSGMSLLPQPLLARIGSTLCDARRDAPVAPGGPFPLVLLSHGLGGFVGQNTHLAEHLASRGYIVLAFAHPGGAAAWLQADGSVAALPAQRREALSAGVAGYAAACRLRGAATLARRRDALARNAALEPLASENRRWARNICRVLDLLEGRAPSTAWLHSACDLSRVAAVGMSFGGSASASAAQQDTRIGAAVNLDGAQYDARLLNRLSRVPLLVLHSGAARFADGGTYTDFHYEPHTHAGHSGRVTRLLLPHAGHLSFTDLALFGSSALRRLAGTAGLDGARTLTLTAEVVCAFLEHALRGAEPLPSQRSRWPELELADLTAVRAVADDCTVSLQD